jgi:acetyltransferase-like isoleucine patch superfamily enzyme
MVADLVYYITKFIFRLLTLILPVEFINRLFYFMPGRLVVDICRWYGAEIGEHVQIMPPILIHNWQDGIQKPFQNLHIGSNINIGRNAFFDLHGKIDIESNCTIAMDVMILTHTNVGNIPIQQDIHASIGKVSIRSGVYVGARALIIASVEIGSNSAIGAGAVVIKDVPPRSIYAGVPAKMIRKLNDMLMVDS